MLVVISPAKTLDYETPLPTTKYTEPAMLADSQKLITVMRDYSAAQLRELMGVSEKIAELNVQRFKDWSVPFTPDNARPALFAFKGDVYEGLDAYSLKAAEIDYAQQHLRMLSGLYGLLRPLDLMQPYRLEMGTKLPNPGGRNLYEFWGSDITERLNGELAGQQEKVLINLASNEYFRSVKTRELNATVITPQFRDWKNGQYKMISFFAKKARGMMARFIIDQKPRTADELKAFDMAGYQYAPDMSKGNDWVFTRKQD
ncbi:peroxide stress protein YaaA [Granulosicoccaceae sp. 1_MG-2023]|nr:peroxide stress protein YaaA [Granulosicoccaceae sp. 1_MG-2023]